MNRCLSALTLLGTIGYAAAGEVVIPLDNKPVKVKQGDTLRVPVNAIAGADIKAEVTGPAKHTRNTVREMSGNQPLIGGMKVEYDIKPTGPGTIKVKVTNKNPTSPDPEVSEFEFVVE